MRACRFGTTPGFNTRCVLRPHMDLPRYRDGQLMCKEKISASYAIRRMDLYHYLSMEAGKTLWASGIPTPIQVLRIFPNTSRFQRKKSGLGAWTQTGSTGERRSRITTALMSSCKPVFSEIRRRTPFLSHGKLCPLRSIGCRCVIPAASPEPTLPGWSISSETTAF